MGKQYVNKDTRETSLVILTENGTTPNLVSSTTTSTHWRWSRDASNVLIYIK